jgi:hypothetical protein
MSVVTQRVTAVETTQPFIPGSVVQAERAQFPGVFKLKLTIADEEQSEPATDVEFLCVTGNRREQVLEELP